MGIWLHRQWTRSATTIRSIGLLVPQLALMLGLALIFGIIRPAPASQPVALPSFCGPLDPPDDGLPKLAAPDLFTLAEAIGSALAAHSQASPQPTMPCVARIWGRDEWALISLRLLAPDGSDITGADQLALAYHASGVWYVALPDAPHYTDWLGAIPADLLPKMPKANLARPPILPNPSQGEYDLPFLAGSASLAVRADTDHDNAIDFSLPTGTPVLAARSGTIEAIVQSNDKCGCNPLFAAYNNYIIIDHGDGEQSYYLHIAKDSVPPDLHPGSFVEQGTIIAASGAVGYTCSLTGDGCGPHLHFEVRQNGLRIVPRFAEVATPVQSWQSYTSTNVLALGSEPTPYGLPATGDFNGDGRADLAAFMADTGTWYVAASAQSPGQATPASGLSQILPKPDSTLAPYHGWIGGRTGATARLVGDFNGDGRVDVALFYGDGGNVYVALSSGQSFNPYSLWLAGSSLPGELLGPPLVGDFNGDGQTDLAFQQPGGAWFVATSKPNTGLEPAAGFNPPTQWSAGFGPNAARMFAADMNGDGRADLVAYSAAGDWDVALSDGTQFALGSRWLSGFGLGSSAQFVGDFNGDGRADAATFSSDRGDWYVALSAGTRLLPPTPWASRLGVGATDRLVGDFDGDGRDDIAAFYARTGALDVALSDGSAFRPPARWIAGYRPTPASQD